MSITIQHLLILPSLRHAKVVAGHRGLDQIVSSISVLEYAIPTCLQDALFHNNEFQGGEIVISALISIKDDVEAQCACIRRLHEVGEVGLILYYVGIFLPDIAKEVQAVAEELDFPILCMPKNRMDQRYSEVIQEVMEAILKDRQKDTYIVASMLDRISLLPPHQRSMDTLLRMLSDRVHASFYLLDSTQHTLNAATWPQLGNVDSSSIFQYLDKLQEGQEPTKLEVHRHVFYGNSIRIQNMAEAMHLMILKENEPLPAMMCAQLQEIVQLFVNIWSQSHGAVRNEELIHAILHDEPSKMRRLADILHISVEKIHSMWMIRIKQREGRKGQIDKIQASSESFLQEYFQLVISAPIEDFLILFMGEEKNKEIEQQLGDMYIAYQKEQGEDVIVCGSYTLKDTSSVREAYTDVMLYLDAAITLYPQRGYLNLMEIQYAKMIRQKIDEGEEVVRKILSVLDFSIRDLHQKEELLHTLCVYLLDGDMRVQKTADLLFVHKNTVKYRIHLLQEKLHSQIYTMPDVQTYYMACALYRCLHTQS